MPLVQPQPHRPTVNPDMTKYVLLYTGTQGAKVPAVDIKAIKALPGIVVSKEIPMKSAYMMHVEGPVTVKRAVNKMACWVASEVHTYESPEPRPGFQVSAGKRTK
jgi:hypothetical protein